METTVNISGMTCGHCVASVIEEITAIDGINGVDVQLNKGGISRAVVTSSENLDPAEVSEAVAQAGYTVVSADA
ncbi:heavy-metal-associated domain-containing protein [Arthrobacter sp. SRS-W-1-2016]|uniref:heavy-metal-associated domain-containing protein n=1 Tax=Arthrobacter sp. SRS-W-1-2016 TaxID=1930254 RepID=UPI000990ECA7|nr:heavy-metal-associated domain-containing protein [Arthrobacter sp. SRS-W-1-2016]